MSKIGKISFVLLLFLSVIPLRSAPSKASCPELLDEVLRVRRVLQNYVTNLDPPSFRLVHRSSIKVARRDLDSNTAKKVMLSHIGEWLTYKWGDVDFSLEKGSRYLLRDGDFSRSSFQNLQIRVMKRHNSTEMGSEFSEKIELPDFWSARYEEEDSEVLGRFWIVDLAFSPNEDGSYVLNSTVRYSQRNGHLGTDPPPPYVYLSRFLRNLMNDPTLDVTVAGISGRLDRAQALETAQITNDFFNNLTNPMRTNPVVLVSLDMQLAKPVFDAGALARKLQGIATVYVEKPGLWLSRALPEVGMPREHSVGKGAIRVYLPGYSPSDLPENHPVLSADKILEFIRWRDQESFLNHLAHQVMNQVDRANHLSDVSSLLHVRHELAIQRMRTEIAERVESLKKGTIPSEPVAPEPVPSFSVVEKAPEVQEKELVDQDSGYTPEEFRKLRNALKKASDDCRQKALECDTMFAMAAQVDEEKLQALTKLGLAEAENAKLANEVAQLRYAISELKKKPISNENGEIKIFEKLFDDKGNVDLSKIEQEKVFEFQVQRPGNTVRSGEKQTIVFEKAVVEWFRNPGNELAKEKCLKAIFMGEAVGFEKSSGLKKLTGQDEIWETKYIGTGHWRILLKRDHNHWTAFQVMD